MYNILLLFLIFHYIGFFIKKPTSNIFSCGIFGWAGGNVKNFSKDKLNILGLANQSRGEDSCGLATNGESFIGIDETKLFEKFLQDRYYDKKVYSPKEVKSIIGHTRKASGGTVNIENAHPFGFGTLNGMFSFMGVHNGTIYNKDGLIEKYEIRPTRRIGKKDRHTKIDSEVLLECIYKSANFDVLSDYRGGAAIAFVNIKTPNKLYLFRGASTKHTYVQDERPMYIYKESKNSLYFSSIERPLLLIGGNDETVEEIEENIVYEITGGNFDKAIKHPIDRSNSSQSMYVDYTSKRNKNKAYKQHSCNFDRNNGYFPSGLGCGIKEYQEVLELNDGYENINENDDLNDDDLDDNFINTHISSKVKETGKDCLYVENNLRYYSKDKKLANGIYYYLPTQGFLFLDIVEGSAIDKLRLLQGKYFFNGIFASIITEVKYTNEAFVPIKKGIDLRKKLRYFFDGCLLKEERDYYAMRVISANTPVSILGLSEGSVNPVMKVEKGDIYKKNIIYENGNVFSGKIFPMGGTKSFYVKEGNLKRIRNKKLVSELASTHIIVKAKTKYSFGEEYTNPFDNQQKIEKFNKMAVSIGEEVIEKSIIQLNSLTKELKIVSTHKLSKEITNALKKCEEILYEIYDKIEDE